MSREIISAKIDVVFKELFVRDGNLLISILKAFLGSFRAGFWQTFGRLFGVNLRTSYNPTKDSKDAIIERVATLIEQGQL